MLGISNILCDLLTIYTYIKNNQCDIKEKVHKLFLHKLRNISKILKFSCLT